MLELFDSVAEGSEVSAVPELVVVSAADEFAIPDSVVDSVNEASLVGEFTFPEQANRVAAISAASKIVMSFFMLFTPAFGFVVPKA